MHISRFLVFVLGIVLSSSGCFGVGNDSEEIAEEEEEEEEEEELCAPTGRSMLDTGVYIAPEACTDVTLYALSGEEDNDAWLLIVGWPMYGDHYSLEITNHTSGDTEREIIYWGDPEFTLFAGDYLLGGFEMVEGDNELEFVVYDPYEDENGDYHEDIIREGTFTLHVTITDSVGE